MSLAVATAAPPGLEAWLAAGKGLHRAKAFYRRQRAARTRAKLWCQAQPPPLPIVLPAHGPLQQQVGLPQPRREPREPRRAQGLGRQLFEAALATAAAPGGVAPAQRLPEVHEAGHPPAGRLPEVHEAAVADAGDMVDSKAPGIIMLLDHLKECRKNMEGFMEGLRMVRILRTLKTGIAIKVK